MNLFKETDEALDEQGYDWSDVRWVGSPDMKFPAVSEFMKVAKATEYDEGYGAQEVPFDLIIMLKDGTWFERAEYDGSEWWVYMRKPIEPSEVIGKIDRLTDNSCMWESLIDFYKRQLS